MLKKTQRGFMKVYSEKGKKKKVQARSELGDFDVM